MLLETERLLMRPLDPGDQDALLAIWGDAETMRFYPHPLLRLQVREWIERNRLRYAEYGGGLFGVLLKATGRLIGVCGPVWQQVEGRNELEVGYHVRRDQWGKGFATEAARGCIAYGFERLDPPGRVISMIRPENAASRRVAEKNGLTLAATTVWRGYRHCIYEVPLRAEEVGCVTDQSHPGRLVGGKS